MKLTQIQEASYLGHEKEGSLKWLLANFFDQSRTIRYEKGPGVVYIVKPGFEVWARGSQIADIEVLPGDHEEPDYQVGVIHRSSGNVIHTYEPVKEMRVTKVKQVWPQESP